MDPNIKIPIEANALIPNDIEKLLQEANGRV